MLLGCADKARILLEILNCSVENTQVSLQSARLAQSFLVVVVRSVIALTPAQSEKLAASLTKQVGQPVHINTEIDPSVLGGIEVRFADEIIDGTISNRLAEASRALAV